MTRTSLPLPLVIVIGLVVASTLVLGGATTTTATADSPEINPDLFADAYSYTDTSAEWTPPSPPRGVEISPREYAYMWTEMPDADLSADELATALNQSANRTDTYLYGIATEFPSAEPSPIENRWNTRVTNRISGGGRGESIAPATASLEDDGSIRDAHLTLIDVTPHTILHADGDDPEYRVPREDGEVIFMFDYRVNEPDESSSGSAVSLNPQSRTQVYSQGSDESNLVIEADGVEVINRSVSDGAQEVSYDELPTGNTELRATLTVESSYKVVEQVRYCDEIETLSHPQTGRLLREYCDEREPWSESQTVRRNTVNSSVTLTDSLTVTVQNQSRPTGQVQEYNADRGDYKLQLQNPAAYGSIKSANRNWINGPYDFYLGHNEQTETIREYSSDGSEQVETGFVTVEHHAYPPDSIATRPDGRFRGDQEADSISTIRALDSTFGSPQSGVSLPESVTVDYLSADSLPYTISQEENYFAQRWRENPAENGQLTLQTLISGETREYQLTEVPTTELQLDAEPTYLSGSRTVEPAQATAMRVTFTLTDGQSNRVNLNEPKQGSLIIKSPQGVRTVKTNQNSPARSQSNQQAPADEDSTIYDARDGAVTLEWTYPGSAGRFAVDFKPSIYWKQSGPYYTADGFTYSLAYPRDGLSTALWGTVTTLIVPIIIGVTPVALMYGVIQYAITGRFPNPLS